VQITKGLSKKKLQSASSLAEITKQVVLLRYCFWVYDSDIRNFWQTKILDKFGYRNQLKGLAMLIKKRNV